MMDDKTPRLQLQKGHRHREFCRLLLAAYAAADSTPQDEKALDCLDVKNFSQQFPTPESQDAAIMELHKRVLSKELLKDHAKLQEILFPLLAVRSSWNKSARARADDVSLNLYTFPEVFAQACPTPEHRRRYLEELAPCVKKELADEAEKDQAFESFVSKIIDRKPPNRGNGLS